jgi:hypothetical protein
MASIFRGEDPAAAVAELLTVVITTSAVVSNPATDMIEEVVDSFRNVPGLAACRLIIFCDGYKTQKDGAKWRPGHVCAAEGERYDEFVLRIQALAANEHPSPLNGATVMAMTERQGFGFGVKMSLAEVTTPFVMIQHHDQRFRRSFNLPALLRAMLSKEHGDAVKYVGAPSRFRPPSVNH